MKPAKKMYIILFISPYILIIILYFILNFSLRMYDKINIFYFLITNHTDYDFYWDININIKTSVKNFKIEKLSWIRLGPKRWIKDHRNIIVNIQIREKVDDSPIIEQTLLYPNGGYGEIVPDSAKGNFSTIIDIILDEEGRIELLYSHDFYTYGRPGEYYYRTLRHHELKDHNDLMQELSVDRFREGQNNEDNK